MPDNPPSEEAIFDAAIELPPDERAAYLDRACADDADLRQSVEALLKSHQEATSFLENPPPDVTLTRTVAMTVPPTEKIGDRIGRYKLLQQIGEGGGGVVYMAEQLEPVRRQVALKVIKLGMDTKSVIARFEAERQALALMDHPNIAKVLDAGATETGRPYFVMELVRGTKITEFCDKRQLSMRERLDLFIQVCQAIQHAHQKGIIHRDIKPSNILVTLNDGVPVPKVIDFGIAKATQQRLTDKTLFTAFEQFIGTPAYMSPEQAEMNLQGVDTRSDIYSLGVLLYELLTGKTPFASEELLQAGIDEIRRIIREEEPVRPSTKLSAMLMGELTVTANHRRTDPPKLIVTVRGDLDWIVMKCLEKDRTRRYETTNGLAADLKRHLADEPVTARPPSNLYRLQKVIRRHRLATAAVAAVLISLVVGLAGTSYFYLQQRHVLFDALLAEAHAHRVSGHTGQRFESLRAVQSAAAIRHDPAVRDEAIAALALPDLRWAEKKTLDQHFAKRTVWCDPDLKQYAVNDENGGVAIFFGADDRQISQLKAPGFRPFGWRGAFSADGRFLKTWALDTDDELCDWVWDLQKQTVVLRALPGKGAGTFSRDGRHFCKSNPDGSFSIYDLETGLELKHLHLDQGYDISWLNLGETRLAGASNGVPEVEIRDAVSGSKQFTLPCPAPVTALAWSFDGKQLAVACDDFRIYIWDVETRKQMHVLTGHFARITDLAFNHAADLLASASWDGVIHLWDLVTEQTIADFSGASNGFQFTGDDRYLGPVIQNDRMFGRLEVAHRGEYRRLRNSHLDDGGGRPQFSADGRVLAASSRNYVWFWDTVTGREIGVLNVPKVWSQIFDPDGDRFFVSDAIKGVSLWPFEISNRFDSIVCRLGPPHLLFAGQGFRTADFSRDGRHLAVAHFEGNEGFVFDLQNQTAKVVLSGHTNMDYIALSPDGRWAASGSWHNSLVKIWDARTGDCLRTLQTPNRTHVAFSPDGQWLATITTTYQLWKTGTWEASRPGFAGQEIPEHNALAFSPDSRIMAVTQENNQIQLRETQSGRVLATLESPDQVTIDNLSFSPDGFHLAGFRGDRQMDLWDLRLIRQELAAMQLDWDQPPYPPAPEQVTYKPLTLTIETPTGTSKP